MKKVICCLLLTFLLLGFGSCVIAEEDKAILSVRGDGIVYLDADRATITIGIKETAEEVANAQNAVNDKMAAIIQALTEKGIEQGNLYTNTISIYPNYDYSQSDDRIVGYTAYNSIDVLITDIQCVGAYIDAAFSAGANTLDNVEFSASDTQDACDRTLALAVENALAKTEILAEAAGMEVKCIEEIEEISNYNASLNYFYRMETADAVAATGTQVMASRLQISASVNIQAVIE